MASARALAMILAVGLGIITIALGVLMWTRWGQARPLAKCAGLSLFAHLLLLCYCYGTRVFFEAPGRATADGTINVRIDDVTDEEEAGPESTADTKELPKVAPVPEVIAHEPPKPEAALSPAPVQIQKTEAPSKPPEILAHTEPATRSAIEETSLPKNDQRVLPAEKSDAHQIASETKPPETIPVDASSSPLEQQPVSAPAIPRRAGDGQEMPAMLRSRVADRLK